MAKPVLLNLDVQAEPIVERVIEENAVAFVYEQENPSLAKIIAPIPFVENVPEV